MKWNGLMVLLAVQVVIGALLVIIKVLGFIAEQQVQQLEQQVQQACGDICYPFVGSVVDGDCYCADATGSLQRAP